MHICKLRSNNFPLCLPFLLCLRVFLSVVWASQLHTPSLYPIFPYPLSTHPANSAYLLRKCLASSIQSQIIQHVHSLYGKFPTIRKPPYETIDWYWPIEASGVLQNNQHQLPATLHSYMEWRPPFVPPLSKLKCNNCKGGGEREGPDWKRSSARSHPRKSLNFHLENEIPYQRTK